MGAWVRGSMGEKIVIEGNHTLCDYPESIINFYEIGRSKFTTGYARRRQGYGGQAACLP